MLEGGESVLTSKYASGKIRNPCLFCVENSFSFSYCISPAVAAGSATGLAISPQQVTTLSGVWYAEGSDENGPGIRTSMATFVATEEVRGGPAIGVASGADVKLDSRYCWHQCIRDELHNTDGQPDFKTDVLTFVQQLTMEIAHDGLLVLLIQYCLVEIGFGHINLVWRGACNGSLLQSSCCHFQRAYGVHMAGGRCSPESLQTAIRQPNCKAQLDALEAEEQVERVDALQAEPCLQLEAGEENRSALPIQWIP